MPPFGDVPDILARLGAERLGPRGQLLEGRLRQQQDETMRQRMLSSFLSTADLSNFRPSDIQSVVGAILGDPNLAVKSAETRFRESLFDESRQRLQNLGQIFEQFTQPESELGPTVSTGEASQFAGQALQQPGGTLQEADFARPFAVDPFEREKQQRELDLSERRQQFLEGRERRISRETQKKPGTEKIRQLNTQIDNLRASIGTDIRTLTGLPKLENEEEDSQFVKDLRRKIDSKRQKLERLQKTEQILSGAVIPQSAGQVANWLSQNLITEDEAIKLIEENELSVQ